jgi:hypothetical protein
MTRASRVELPPTRRRNPAPRLLLRCRSDRSIDDHGGFAMKNAARLVLLTIAGAVCLAAPPAAADSGNSIQRACSARTLGPYGFQCNGYANVGAGLEPVTFVGTVSGSPTGVFDGYGTFSSSLGSNRMHSIGQAIFQDRTCFGHIQYQQFLVTPGGEIDLHQPLDIDFTTVDGGFEILGTPVALPGATGAGVPRMSCRLVKVRSQNQD